MPRRKHLLLCAAMIIAAPLGAAAVPQAANDCLAAWEPVIASLPAHPLAPQALDCVVAGLGGERCAALAAVAREFFDGPLGLYALDTLHAECRVDLEGLLTGIADTRTGARLAAILAQDAPQPEAVLQTITAAHPGTQAAAAATLLGIERLVNAGQDTAALEFALGALDGVIKQGDAPLLRWTELAAMLPGRCGLPVLAPLMEAMPAMPALLREAAARSLADLLVPVLRGEAWPARGRLDDMLAALKAGPEAQRFGALQVLGLCGQSMSAGALDAATGFLASLQTEQPWDAIFTIHAARVYLHAAAEAARDVAWSETLRGGADRLTRALIERLEAPAGAEPLLLAFASEAALQLGREHRFLGEARCLRLLLARAPGDAQAPAWRARLASIESGVWRNHAEAARLTRAEWAGGDTDRAALGAVMREIRYLYLGDDVKAARALIQRLAISAPEAELRNEVRLYEILCEFRYGDVEKAKVLINDFMEHRYTSPYFFQVMLLRAYLLFLWGDEQEAAKTCAQLARATLNPDQARKARELASDLAGIAARSAEPRPAPRAGAPNIIFISLDTVRPDRLGCYGAPGGRTPNIDDLAAHGTVFERAYSTSSWTKPSHASVFTGRYPTAHGAEGHDDQIAPRAALITERLRTLGYLTMGVISAPPLNSIFGFGRGFDIYDDHLYELDRVCNLFLRGGDSAVKIHSGATGPLITHAAMLMYNRRAAKDVPYFFFVNYFDAHHNYLPVFPFNAKSREGYFGNEWGVIDPWTAGPQPFDPQTAKIDRQRLLELYDDEIASVDAQVGTWLYRTRAEGHFDNTIFVVFSDHGEEFLEHGNLAHGNGLNNEVLQVPLILCGPGIPKGMRIDTPVSLVDILPTVLALIGEPVPGDLDGVDLGPLLRGEVLPSRPLFASLDLPAFQGYAVMDGAEKAIVDTRTPACRLFDIATDPGEQHDLATQRAARLNQLAQLAARKHDELRQAGLSLDSGAVIAPGDLPSLDALVEQLRAMGYLGK